MWPLPRSTYHRIRKSTWFCTLWVWQKLCASDLGRGLLLGPHPWGLPGCPNGFLDDCSPLSCFLSALAPTDAGGTPALGPSFTLKLQPPRPFLPSFSTRLLASRLNFCCSLQPVPLLTPSPVGEYFAAWFQGPSRGFHLCFRKQIGDLLHGPRTNIAVTTELNSSRFAQRV